MRKFTVTAAIARHAAYLPDEVRHRLGLRAAPRATAFGRLLAHLDSDTVDAAVGAWPAEHRTRPDQDEELCAVAVDGRSLRGSSTAATRAVHLPAATGGPDADSTSFDFLLGIRVWIATLEGLASCRRQASLC
ncbi:hypothetical protein [Streptomyces sp. NPDC058632]|uniref:hypothetical protein n=1 Tax=unclassified Streptomyces TaxID=2593676 RepID=UPI0036695834